MEQIVSEQDAIIYFTSLKWPHGFRCPRCASSEAYVIESRRLPLHQCRNCRHQTTVMTGTVMEKSRTPLVKWYTTMQLLSASSGVNAVQLSDILQVSYKTAWSMLHKIRLALSAFDLRRPMSGSVRAGLLFYGSANLHPYVRHPLEHPIFVAKSETYDDKPPYIKMKLVPLHHLTEKMIEYSGEVDFVEKHLHRRAIYVGLLNRARLRQEPYLKEPFHEAKRWINRTFRGIGGKHQQLYWDEFCFRWNMSKRKVSIITAMAKACLSHSTAQHAA